MGYINKIGFGKDGDLIGLGNIVVGLGIGDDWMGFDKGDD